MNNWQEIGYNLEAKLLTNGEVWVRNNWQASDYPHLILDVNSQGTIINIRTSDGSHAGSVESRYAIASLVKEKILQSLFPQ